MILLPPISNRTATHVPYTTHIRSQRGLGLLERARILQLRGDRGAGAAAAVGVGDHVRVAPALRIHRVAVMEHAGDRPDLAAQTDLIADIEPGELALRAGADPDLALAGADALALDDLHVRAPRPGLPAEAAQTPPPTLLPQTGKPSCRERKG